MALTSATLESVVVDQYLANSSWEGDLDKAKARKEAVDWLVMMRPASMTEDNQAMTWASLLAEQQRLSNYIAANTESGGDMRVRLVSFGRPR